MIRRPPRSTRTDTLFPYTTLFRSLRIIAWRLTADSNLDPGLVRLADCLGDHPGDGRVPLVEQLGEDARVPVHAKHELGQVVGPDRKAVEPGRELFGKHDVGRYFAHHIDLKAILAPSRSEEHTSELQSLMR